MSTSMTTTGFRHEALMYGSVFEFVATGAAFLRAGLAADEAMLVAVGQDKIDLLRSELDADAGAVDFVDMTMIGRNPATIIAAWSDFVDAHAGGKRSLRGIGEPIWPGRSDDEVVECHNHEALLNVAFDDDLPFYLLCPYDTMALDQEAVETARHTHPFVDSGAGACVSDMFDRSAQALIPLTAPLPEAPPTAIGVRFDADRLRECRALLAAQLAAAELDPERAADLAVAVSEIATNSVVHGGGEGVLRIWRDDSAVVCEVADGGRITDPLVGRRRPDAHQVDGRGLWLANNLCDLVQLRSGPTGVVVRLQMTLG